jgi:hypothetical protein
MNQLDSTGNRTAAASPAQHETSGDLLGDIATQTPPAPAKVDGILIGTLCDVGADGSLWVSLPALGQQRLSAVALVALTPESAGRSVAVGFESGNPRRPIVLGLMHGATAASDAAQQQTTRAPLQAVADGECVVIEAEREIELRCGEASIVLTADGRIHLRGEYITSQASATQRILGGSVNMN